MFRFVLSLGLLKSINAVFPLLVLPFVTRILTPEDFALYFLSNVWMTFLQPFLSLNIQTGQRKLSVDGSTSSGGILCVSTLIFLVSMAVFILIICSITYAFGFALVTKATVFLTIFATLGVSVNSSLDTYFVTRFNTKSIFLYSLFASLSVWGLMIYLLIIFESWTARLVSQGSVYLFLALGWLFISSERWSLACLKEVIVKNIASMLKIGLPLVLVILTELTLLHLDKLFSQNILNSFDLARYVSFFQVAMMPMFATVALSYGLEPHILRGKFSSNMRKQFTKVLVLIGLCFFVTLLFQSLISHFFVNQKTNTFDPILTLLIFACLFKAFIVLLVPFFIAGGQQKKLLYRYLFALIIYVPCLYFFGQSYGSLGIAVAFLVAHAFLFGLLISDLRKFWSIV